MNTADTTTNDLLAIRHEVYESELCLTGDGVTAHVAAHAVKAYMLADLAAFAADWDAAAAAARYEVEAIDDLCGGRPANYA